MQDTNVESAAGFTNSEEHLSSFEGLLQDPVFLLSVQRQLLELSHSKRTRLSLTTARNHDMGLSIVLRDAALQMAKFCEAHAEEFVSVEDFCAVLSGKLVPRMIRSHNKRVLERVILSRSLGDAALVSKEKDVAALVGDLRTILLLSLQDAHEVQRFPRKRLMWKMCDALHQRGVSFLSGFDVAKIATVTSAMCDETNNYLGRLEAFPSVPASAGGGALDYRRRFLRQLALFPVRHRRRANSMDCEVADILAELFGCETLHVQPFSIDNTPSLVTQLHRILELGRVQLVATSCPDYSGRLNANGLWQCDFRTLATGIGFVASRGIPFIERAYEVLKRRVEVEILHFEPSFEVVDGFHGTVPVAPVEATRRLRASSRAIVAELASRGLSARGLLTRDVISEDDFMARKHEIFEELVPQRDEPVMRELTEKILKFRSDLYQGWFASSSGESEHEFRGRLLNTIIPEQIAEYVLVGELMMQSQPQTSLILAYDSPFMCEVHALMKRPALFGRVKHLGYAN